MKPNRPKSPNITAALTTAGILIAALAGGLWFVTGGDIASALQIAMIIMPIPVLIAALVIYKSFELVRASKWREASARIAQSEMRQEHRQRSDDVSTVLNVPVVEYEFSVDGNKHRGSRVSIGESPGNTADATAALDRYRVGISVPVYYDPVNPSDCVLEREPPVRLGCFWAGAALLMVAGLALVAAIFRGAELQNRLAAYMPAGAHPIFVIFFAFAGVFVLLILLAQRRQAAAARRWPVAQGRIVSSKTECYTRRDSDRAHTSTYYEAVVEYAYKVDGREYHSTQLTLGGKVATNSKTRADAKAAQCTPGAVVEVHYDPQNPSNATLEIKVAFAGLWLIIAIACFVLAAWFGGYLHR